MFAQRRVTVGLRLPEEQFLEFWSFAGHDGRGAIPLHRQMLYVTGLPGVFKAVRLVIRDQPRPWLCQDLSLRPTPTGFAFQFLVTPGQQPDLVFRLRQCMASCVFDASTDSDWRTMTAIRCCPRVVTTKLRNYERFDKVFVLMLFRRFSTWTRFSLYLCSYRI